MLIGQRRIIQTVNHHFKTCFLLSYDITLIRHQAVKCLIKGQIIWLTGADCQYHQNK